MSHSKRINPQPDPHLSNEDKEKSVFFTKKNTKADSTGNKGAFFQAKLSVGRTDDAYEKEADAVANTVTNNQSDKPVIQQQKISHIQRLATPQEDEKLTSTNDERMKRDKEIQEKPEVQRMCADCEKENEKEKDDTVQAKPEGAGTASTQVSSKIKTTSGKGNGLGSKTLSDMNAAFGVDFSNVNIHTNNEAIQMNSELRAQAFTHGSDIYFNSGKYNPDSDAGKQLLAHELTHVIQQGQDNGPLPETIQRAPLHGTETIHDELIEQYRRENGYPPHGIDKATGQQVGPTDSEIRFGGLLDAWLLSKKGSGSPTTTQGQGTANKSVAAPSTKPTIVSTGGTNVVAACQTATDVGACRTHQDYILNILPQAIANIGNVASPYNRAIHTLFSAILPGLKSSAAPVPNKGGVSISANNIAVTIGTLPFTFSKFTVSLTQWLNGSNGQAFNAGGPIAFIDMNELSKDALFKNLGGIEETITHEMMHVFMEITEAQNAINKQQGKPLVNPNLDRSGYSTVHTSLAKALLPFVTQIAKLPSMSTLPPNQQKIPAQNSADSTANTFLSETIARVEGAIHAKERVGAGYSAVDLQALTSFFLASSYWSQQPPVIAELDAFITANKSKIDSVIKPLIVQAGQTYLNLRP
jgi:hypothetical protein